MLMLSWAPATAAAGAGLRGAAEAEVVRVAAPNMASRAAVITDVRKGRLLSCGHSKWLRLAKLGKERIVPRATTDLALTDPGISQFACRTGP